MDELIPLITHSPFTRQRAKLTWETTLDGLESQAPNSLGNFKRINIIAQTPERLTLLVRYYRWPDSEPVIQKAGTERSYAYVGGEGFAAAIITKENAPKI